MSAPVTPNPPDDPLRYDLWIEDAFRSVVRRALHHAEAHGLPGDHHFYITFRTGHPGVRMPPYLKASHPDEITIVLQFKFDDLAANDDGFSVSLSFKGKRENLHVPWAAVTSFTDPSVNFGLQFKIAPQGAGAVEASAAGLKTTAAGLKPAAEDLKTDGGQVIALDSFRKK